MKALAIVRALALTLLIASAPALRAMAWCEPVPYEVNPENAAKAGVRVHQAPEMCGAGFAKLWVEVPSTQSGDKLIYVSLDVRDKDGRRLFSTVVASKESPTESPSDAPRFTRTHDLCLQNTMVKGATFSIWYGDFNKDCGTSLLVVRDPGRWPSSID